MLVGLRHHRHWLILFLSLLGTKALKFHLLTPAAQNRVKDFREPTEKRYCRNLCTNRSVSKCTKT